MLLEEFGKVISEGGSCIVISSQSGHRLGALTPNDELLKLDMLKEKNVKNTLTAYQLAKRCNVLRVASEAVK